MIAVDSSVWIAHLRNVQSSAVNKLRTIDSPEDIVVGDIVLMEVLQGARNDAHAEAIERNLRQFTIANMSNDLMAVVAARNYRRLRDRGVTVRKTIDVIIATYCMVQGHRLLHDDRDFDPIARYLGLEIA
jgi:hypothetical protein